MKRKKLIENQTLMKLSDKMSKNDTRDNIISTDGLESNFGPTCGTKDVVKKPIHITSRHTWKGKPTEMTSKDKIDENGKEQKYSCQFEEKYTVDIKGDKLSVSSVYITELMYNQLDKLVPDDQSIDEIFHKGKKTGTLHIVKRKNLKPGGMNYWSFLNDKQLKEVEIVN